MISSPPSDFLSLSSRSLLIACSFRSPHASHITSNPSSALFAHPVNRDGDEGILLPLPPSLPSIFSSPYILSPSIWFLLSMFATYTLSSLSPYAFHPLIVLHYFSLSPAPNRREGGLLNKSLIIVTDELFLLLSLLLQKSEEIFLFPLLSLSLSLYSISPYSLPPLSLSSFQCLPCDHSPLSVTLPIPPHSLTKSRG